MDSSLEKIKGDALSLPVQDRAELAQVLLSSLDDQTASESTETDWDTELELRVKAIREGEVQGIPAEEVFGKVH
jgi:putative addiction module component (TIGR02574 family)